MTYSSQHEDLIKKTGLKVTAARKAVLNIVQTHNHPIDVGHIRKDLSKLSVNADEATVYRIIDSFSERGLIDKLQFQEKKFFYELRREEHHHAICTNCGKIEDVSNCSIDTIENQIEKTKGFKVKSHSLEFFGLCKNCK